MSSLLKSRIALGKPKGDREICPQVVDSILAAAIALMVLWLWLLSTRMAIVTPGMLGTSEVVLACLLWSLRADYCY